MTDYENITPKQAIQIQEELRNKIELESLDLDQGIKTVGGADISFNRGSNRVHAGIVVLSLPNLEVKARSLISTEVDFPYIPGLLAFREIPALMEAWEQCRQKPDVLLLDGHGIAHPRRMGIATHFGILANHPTIGCAKNVLTGSYEEPDTEKGKYSYLMEANEKIGIVLRSRTNVNPIYISPGHKTDFEDTLAIVGKALSRYKLPETTRATHRLVNELRKGEIDQGYVEF
ncbi:deoxyribonuclease V [Aliifodinibius sp. S!AR15-10]|uniref:deoxyribonuclease V n=1 Tax=Aliifodinibius sp. S!AR15-10 TaxID=2950437 RepID=UPI00287013B5|nr:deoxyribonuclease V [Aliifodinibius sp. S!AR15-10]